MTNDRYRGSDPHPDPLVNKLLEGAIVPEALMYDAIQRPRNYNHATLSECGFTWVTQRDGRVRPDKDHPTRYQDRVISRLCSHCEMPFCYVGSESDCPYCNFVNSANSEHYG